MAAIDKTYINSWEKYKELFDFFTECGKVIDKYGNVFKPINYLWKISEKEFNDRVEKQSEHVLETYNQGGYKWSLENGYMTQAEYDYFNPYDHVSIPIMNTPTFFDVWMIRNCQHIEWLQDDLKSKYSGGWSKEAFTDHNNEDSYYQILNHTSVYDTYQRNGVGKNLKINKNLFPVIPVYFSNRILVSVQVSFNNETWWYHESEDYWCCNKELHRTNGWISSRAYIRNKSYKPKTIFRKIKKWNLPKGANVHINVFIIDKHNRRYHTHFNLTVNGRFCNI